MKADYLNWTDAMKIVDMLKKDNTFQSKQYLVLTLLGFFSGLRIGDILSMKYQDVKPIVKIKEEKTKKRREITISEDVLRLIESCKEDLMKSDDDFVVPYTSAWTSKILKQLAHKIGVWDLAVSNHTMRKTFARAIWNNNKCTDESLVMLSEILMHSSTSITRKYLGIRNEEIKSCYLGLSLNPKT